MHLVNIFSLAWNNLFCCHLDDPCRGQTRGACSRVSPLGCSCAPKMRRALFGMNRTLPRGRTLHAEVEQPRGARGGGFEHLLTLSWERCFQSPGRDIPCWDCECHLLGQACCSHQLPVSWSGGYKGVFRLKEAATELGDTRSGEEDGTGTGLVSC